MKSDRFQNQYNVHGKTKVKSNICDFDGTIMITAGRKQEKDKIVDGILDSDEKVAASIAVRGVAVSDCEFRENPDQKYTGVFKGKLTTLFYIDQSNIIHYDDLNNYSDRYINNAFVGTWASYDGKTIKKVHWGNWRIPYPCGLDVGAGEFHPAVKYLDRGWEFFKNEDNVVKKGADGVWYRQKESDWWK